MLLDIGVVDLDTDLIPKIETVDMETKTYIIVAKIIE